MSAQTITITTVDAVKLRELLREISATDYRNTPYLSRLRGELERARIVPPEQVEADIVTMHSTVELRDLENNELASWTLVFPDEADLDADKLSVLAPIGTAMLGYRAGDTFRWETPAGEREMRIEKVVYQPESAGSQE